MLKNKEERRKYLEDEHIWSLLTDLDEVKTKLYGHALPDGTKLFKYVTVEKPHDNVYAIKGTRTAVKYRVKKDGYISDEVSMTYLVDLIGKIKHD